MEENFKIFDKKLLILYMLDTVQKPLSTDQIVKLYTEVEETSYFEVCEIIDDLRKNDYIILELSDNTEIYSLSETGKKMLQELIEFIPGLDLYKLKKMISTTIADIKKDFEIGTSVVPLKQNQYKVKCYIKDDNEEIFNIMLIAGNKDDAKNISKNWQENSNEIHEKIINMLTGE